MPAVVLEHRMRVLGSWVTVGDPTPTGGGGGRLAITTEADQPITTESGQTISTEPDPA